MDGIGGLNESFHCCCFVWIVGVGFVESLFRER